MRAFQTIWFGQLISIIGSAISGFCDWDLGLSTDRVSLSLCADRAGGGVATAVDVTAGWRDRRSLEPPGGDVAGRFCPRTVQPVDLGALCDRAAGDLASLCDRGAGCVGEQLSGASLSGSHSPACGSVAVGRANGMVDLARGAGQLLAPLLGGFLIGRIGLHWHHHDRFAHLFGGSVTLMLVRVPNVIAAAGVGRCGGDG